VTVFTFIIFQEKLDVKYSYYRSSVGELLEPGGKFIVWPVLNPQVIKCG